MQRIVFTALALALPTVLWAQDAPASHAPQPKDQLPSPTAEPDNAAAYGPPVGEPDIGPTLEDRGPAQRHFILATEPDKLALEADPPTIANLPAEKIALDKHIRIPLIHDVENGGDYYAASNHALLFEIQYINWGAVTGEQLLARRGHYFTITWVNHGPRDNFTAKFQYRQSKSKEIVRTLVEPMPNVGGAVRSYFAVVGKAYLSYGPIASWRFTILRGDTVVAETKSFIW
jgi:hypothetical protein